MLRSTLSLIRLSSHSRKILSHVAPSVMSVQVNHIYGDSYLKIDLFSKQRDRVDQQFGPAKDKFFERIREQVAEGKESELVFTEDLKNAIYLLKNTPEDLELLKKMVKKYSAQNTEMRFGSFVFGPVIMRLLHHFNQADLALEFMKDESMSSIFGQVNSTLLSMNLLFRNNRDKEVMNLFELVNSRETFLPKYPHDCVTQYLAAAKRLNTPEAFEQAKALVVNVRKAGTNMQLRATNLLASLALNQNEPSVAVELLSVVERGTAVDRSLKLIAYGQLNRPDEAIALLRYVVGAPTTVAVPPKVYEEALGQVRESLNKAEDNKSLIEEFENVCDQMKQRGMIKTESIDSYLERELERRVFSEEERTNNRIGLGTGPRRGLNMPNDYQRGREGNFRSYDREDGMGQRFENRGFNDRRGGYNDRRGGMDDRRSGMDDRRSGMDDRRGGYNDRRGGMGDRRSGFSRGQDDGLDDYTRDKQRFVSRKLMDE